jgi:hypothetical protein
VEINSVCRLGQTATGPYIHFIMKHSATKPQISKTNWGYEVHVQKKDEETVRTALAEITGAPPEKISIF